MQGVPNYSPNSFSFFPIYVLHPIPRQPIASQAEICNVGMVLKYNEAAFLIICQMGPEGKLNAELFYGIFRTPCS